MQKKGTWTFLTQYFKYRVEVCLSPYNDIRDKPDV